MAYFNLDCKMMMMMNLANFLKSNHLLRVAQAGFPRKRSTEEQVAAVTQFIHDGFHIYAQTSYSRTSPEVTTASG